MKKKVWLISKFVKWELQKSLTESSAIYKYVGFTSSLKVLHHIAVLNKKWKENGAMGVPFMVEELSSVSKKDLDKVYSEYHQYETC